MPGQVQFRRFASHPMEQHETSLFPGDIKTSGVQHVGRSGTGQSVDPLEQAIAATSIMGKSGRHNYGYAPVMTGSQGNEFTTKTQGGEFGGGWR